MSTGGLDDGVACASAARRTPLLPPSIVEVNGGMAALHDGTKGADAPFPELLPDQLRGPSVQSEDEHEDDSMPLSTPEAQGGRITTSFTRSPGAARTARVLGLSVAFTCMIMDAHAGVQPPTRPRSDRYSFTRGAYSGFGHACSLFHESKLIS